MKYEIGQQIVGKWDTSVNRWGGNTPYTDMEMMGVLRVVSKGYAEIERAWCVPNDLYYKMTARRWKGMSFYEKGLIGKKKRIGSLYAVEVVE